MTLSYPTTRTLRFKRTLTYLPIIAALLFPTQFLSQDVFTTTKGTIQIMTVREGTPIIFSSNELIVNINYETSGFTMRLDKSTLSCGIDSIDQKLRAQSGTFFEYEGNLGMDYVKTQKHVKKEFEVSGYLTCSPHNEYVIGRGSLDHLLGGFYSCILNLSFELNLNDLSMDTQDMDFEDHFRIEIIQTVLNREE